MKSSVRKIISSTVVNFINESVSHNEYIINQIKSVGLTKDYPYSIGEYRTKEPILINVDDFIYGHDDIEAPTKPRKIDEPIHIYIEDINNKYLEVVDGNHRLSQAKFNKNKTIKSFVYITQSVFEKIFNK